MQPRKAWDCRRFHAGPDQSLGSNRARKAGYPDDHFLWSGRGQATLVCAAEGEMASLIYDDQMPAGVAAAELAGLAPLADESGGQRGKRRIRGERASIRLSLFTIAMRVASANPAIADFTRRLKERGLKALQIWIAVARKVLVML